MSEQNSTSEKQNEARQEWERLLEPEESAKAYESFCFYLELPTAERSVLAAYNAFQQKNGKKPASTTPGDWNYRSTTFKWKERAASYDSHLASEKRRVQEEERKAHIRAKERDHLEKLDGFREQLHDLNGAALSAAVLLLEKCVDRLQSVSDEDLKNLPLKEVGNLIRSATSAATTAIAAQASSLAVDELIGLLGDDQSGTEDT